MAVPAGAALAGSIDHTGTAATAQTDFDVRRNGASVGTIRFPFGAATPTFIAASAVTFDPDDRLSVAAPGGDALGADGPCADCSDRAGAWGGAGHAQQCGREGVGV